MNQVARVDPHGSGSRVIPVEALTLGAVLGLSLSQFAGTHHRCGSSLSWFGKNGLNPTLHYSLAHFSAESYPSTLVRDWCQSRETPRGRSCAPTAT